MILTGPPTYKMRGKKNPDDDDDNGKCNGKILYSYIAHIVQTQCGFKVFDWV
jgi:hypothetical protein